MPEYLITYTDGAQNHIAGDILTVVQKALKYGSIESIELLHDANEKEIEFVKV